MSQIILSVLGNIVVWLKITVTFATSVVNMGVLHMWHHLTYVNKWRITCCWLLVTHWPETAVKFLFLFDPNIYLHELLCLISTFAAAITTTATRVRCLKRIVNTGCNKVLSQLTDMDVFLWGRVAVSMGAAARTASTDKGIQFKSKEGHMVQYCFSHLPFIFLLLNFCCFASVNLHQNTPLHSSLLSSLVVLW